jgi:NRPS condensation-like uncharacterized protein
MAALRLNAADSEHEPARRIGPVRPQRQAARAQPAQKVDHARHAREPAKGDQALAAAHGATLNDVVLALVSGALRRYLRTRGGIPAKSLVVAMTCSLRSTAWSMP